MLPEPARVRLASAARVRLALPPAFVRAIHGRVLAQARLDPLREPAHPGGTVGFVRAGFGGGERVEPLLLPGGKAISPTRCTATAPAGARRAVRVSRRAASAASSSGKRRRARWRG